jgi:Tol biopolymer transport system component
VKRSALLACALGSAAIAAAAGAQAGVERSALASTNEEQALSNGRIVFTSVRGNGALELWAMDANGGRQHALTRGVPFGSTPVWSPDGQSIGFDMTTGETHELWTVRPDGTGRRRIFRTGMPFVSDTQLALAWSPDGTRIAFAQEWGDGRIHVLTLRTGRVIVVGPRWATSPTWSPDGTRLAFEWRPFKEKYRASIATMRADGGNARAIASGESPSWSPQGDLIAFTGRIEHDPYNTSYPLSVVRPDGTGIRVLTSDQVDWDPAWAPDGSRIAMNAFTPGQSVDGLVVVSRDGSGRRLIAAEGRKPTWAPDGRTIAFEDGAGISAVELNGPSRPRPILAPIGDYGAAWSPDGSVLAAGHFDARDDFDGVVLRDGSGRWLRALTEDIGGKLSWSPDGAKLAGDTGAGIAVVTVGDGSSREIVRDEGAGDPSKGEPSWSPDGRTIAYVVFDDGDEADNLLALYDTRTGRTRELFVKGESPAWSPDGTRLAFERTTRCGRGKCRAVFVYRLNSRQETLLARNADSPAWSPDGHWIVFVRRQSVANSEIYVMRADGSRQRRLTRNPGLDATPHWQAIP